VASASEIEMAGIINGKWRSLRDSTTMEQKDAIAFSFVSVVIGVGDEVAKAFARGDYEAEDKVGGGASTKEASEIRAFWKNLFQIVPDLHTEEEKARILEVGNSAVASNFLDFYLQEYPWDGRSPILEKLHVNAHIYK